MNPFASDVDFLAMPPWLGAPQTMPSPPSVRNAYRPDAVSWVATMPKILMAVAIAGAVAISAPHSSLMATGDPQARVSVAFKSDAEMAWDSYLARLQGGRFGEPHVNAVRTVWDHFLTVNARLQPPQTAPTPEDALSMVWDSGEHHLEVDVDAHRKVSFFYSNRHTRKTEAREGSLASHLPKRLDEIVKLLA